MANLQNLRNQIKKQNVLIEELNSQLDIYNTAQTELQILNIKYANQIQGLINDINNVNLNGGVINSSNLKVPLTEDNLTINGPRQKLVNQIKNMQKVIKRKNNRITKLSTVLPTVNLHIDGEIEEIKFLPLRKKINRFIEMTKETLLKLNVEQLGDINNITNNLSSVIADEDEADKDEADEDEADEDEADEANED